MSKPGLLQSVIANIGSPWRRIPTTRKADDLASADPERRVRGLFRMARAQMRAGENEAALSTFERALAAAPDFADAVAVKAELLDMLGKAREAAPEYERSRRLWERQRSGAPDRSYVFRQHGRFAFEVEAYELALERIRTGVFPLLACGNVLLAQGHPTEALRCYDRALKLRPNNHDLMAMRAEALSMQGRYQPAIDAFDSALAALPKSPELLSGRAIARAALGRLGEANADWRRQLELLPAGQRAARAYVALRLADWQLAKPDLDWLADRHPDDLYWKLYRLAATRRLGGAPDKVEPPSPDAAWPAPLVRLHAGAATPEEAMACADTPERRAEVAFQLAVLALPGDPAAAIKSWNEVVRAGQPAMIEHAASLNELSRLHS